MMAHCRISLFVIALTASCSGQPCRRNQFPCADGSLCIKRGRFCDGRLDCRDGSDERWRSVDQHLEENSTFCRGNIGHICVLPIELLPFKKTICDENWRCRGDEFPCADGSKCIGAHRLCDGKENCRDGSDEPRRNISNTNSSSCTEINNDQKGASARPRPRKEPPRRSRRLPRKEASQCRRHEFPCKDGSGCVSPKHLCDDKSNCDDESDEFPSRQAGMPGENSTICRGAYGRICVLPAEYTSRKSDLCNEDWQCQQDELLCDDGSRCLQSKYFCDGTVHCRDRSDEQLWSRYTQYDDQVTLYRRLNGLICILPVKYKSVKIHLCQKHPKLCQCKDDSTHFLDDNCFRCLSQPARTFPVSRICDGVVHCPDLSDECLCPLKSRLKMCQNLHNDNEGKYASQRQHYFKCNPIENQTQILLLANRVCDGRKDCVGGEDEMGCYKNDSTHVVPDRTPEMRTKNFECKLERKRNATKCDGNRECRHFKSEECDCPNAPQYCQYFGNDSIFARCGAIEIRKKMMCDGIKDCYENEDERYCQSTRFYCTEEPLPSIPKEKRCDRVNDCPNGEDERNCSYFHCNDNGTVEYLLLGQVCDGYKDCDSGRDECVCVDSVFSDEVSMIKSKVILAIVWLISLSAIVGCGAVIAVTVRDLVWPSKSAERKASSHTKLIKMTILSLSVSDFLVAIYTLSICIKAVEFGQDYCKVDREWRSSVTCSALGAVLVIGSEQSVFTMVIIAGTRLFSVTRPFSHPDIRLATFILLLTWATSVILGVVPLIPSAEDYFLKSILFEGSKLFKITYQNDTQHLINWLGLINNGHVKKADAGATDWMRLRKLVTNVNPNISVAYEFGYYSSHTVCLPTLFPSKSQDQSWPFTLLLLTINFLAFVVMLIMYMILYRQVTVNDIAKQSRSVQERRLEQSATMQRRLTRILVSDFLCWTPICVMGFLQISGVPIPNDAYLPAGLLIIPINSALNPLLYSDIPDVVIAKLTKFGQFIWTFSKKEPEVIEMVISGDTGKSNV